MVDLAVERHRLRPSFATVLTLVVTPAMLMVFTRAKRREGERRGLLSRLFRRGKGGLTTGGAETPGKPSEFPKAAE